MNHIQDIYNILAANPEPFNTIIERFYDMKHTDIDFHLSILDQLDTVEIIMEIEKEYGFDINDELGNELLDKGFYNLYSKANIVEIRDEKLKSIGI